eukprot:COSAG01_NODE_9539_length_2415_cov_1.990069_5_plen_96_part_00
MWLPATSQVPPAAPDSCRWVCLLPRPPPPLRYNDIGGDGGKAIAEALPKCNTLRQFLLRGNAIGDVGGSAIADVINDSTLELLDVSSCDLGECVV